MYNRLGTPPAQLHDHVDVGVILVCALEVNHAAVGGQAAGVLSQHDCVHAGRPNICCACLPAATNAVCKVRGPPERAPQAGQDFDLPLDVVKMLRLLLGCMARSTARAARRCCAGRCTILALMQQGAAGQLRGGQGCMQRDRRQKHARRSARARFGMSSVLDTDLQANSMPLLRSTTTLHGVWFSRAVSRACLL